MRQEEAPEPAASTGEQHVRRSAGHAEHGCGLADAHSVDVAKQERDLLALGQGAQRGVDAAGELGAFEFVHRSGRLGHGLQGHGRTPAAGAHVVEGGVDGHTVEPRGQVEVRLVLGQVAEHLDQHLLRHVLRVVRVVHDPQRQVVDRRRVATVQGLERLAPAGPQAGKERRLVGGSSRDVRLSCQAMLGDSTLLDDRYAPPP